MKPILEASSVKKLFKGRGRSLDVMALNDIDFLIYPGEVIGIVGESGSGKSTLSRILVGIEKATEGQVLHNGEAVESPSDWQKLRLDIQYIFQDPFLSLAPHMTVGQSIRDGLDIREEGTPLERNDRVARTLELVGLKASDANSYPAVFSGGQKQRICLARALILNPKVIICDEIVSGLDVSVQAQILNLLVELNQKNGVGLVFVSHDLRVVKYLCQRIIVMHKGMIVEANTTEELFTNPKHEYTQHLLSSVPAGLSIAGV
jgi:ABC-type oligopeptide transport system ATPase subunit